MKSRICLLFCLAFIATSLNSQVNFSKDHQWGMTAGWTEAYLADHHFSPLLYQSDVLQVGGIYQRDQQQFFEVSLSVQIGTIQARRLNRRKGTFYETPDLFGEQEAYD
ncbi:MAG: hypothetical protein AAGJ93_09605, partial [Bacteroidota bacterium]